MKFALLSLASALCFSLAAQSSLPADIQLKTLDGRDFSTTDLARADGATVVALWATWCAPCKMELDVYKEFYPMWKEKYGAEVYAVSIDRGAALKKVPGMVESKGWTFPVLTDESHELMSALELRSIPQIYIIDRDGKIVYEHAGYSKGDEEKVEAVLAKAG